ncbi:hypothetical protein BJ741DRAFT_300852 [Chytriomyces cf. hyalinus JEL632]|nr:hypothetical protein BJ741DRAFT_300852 [Chytriomyces cf. hyalinus JEL632]
MHQTSQHGGTMNDSLLGMLSHLECSLLRDDHKHPRTSPVAQHASFSNQAAPLYFLHCEGEGVPDLFPQPLSSIQYLHVPQSHPLSFEFTPSAIEQPRNTSIDNHPLLKVAEAPHLVSSPPLSDAILFPLQLPVFPAHTRQHSDASLLHLESILPHNVECNAPLLPRDNNDRQVSETSSRVAQPVKRLNPSTGKRYVRNPVPRKEKAALKLLFVEDCRPGPERIEEIAKMLQLNVRKVHIWFQNQRAQIKRVEQSIS